MRPVKELNRYRTSYVFTVTGSMTVQATSEPEARAMFAQWGTMTRLSRGGDWKVAVSGVEIIPEERYLAEVEANELAGQARWNALLAKWKKRAEKKTAA
jgi:hypothetical protein